MTSATSNARPGEQHRVLTDLVRPQVGVASAASDRVTPELDLERDDTGGASVSADVLARIRGPRDLHGLSRDELTKLAAAIRAFLIEKVSVSGGHLGRTSVWSS